MINKIGVDTTNRCSAVNSANNKRELQEPSFKGMGGVIIAGIQACERMPMVNVAVIDMLSAILPRTIVESMTNWFAGFEAFRRESSGLVVNCLIPSVITLGIAKMINGFFMPKGVSMANCWADSSLINQAKDYYNQAESSDKVQETFKKMIGDIKGYSGDKEIRFKEVFTEEELNKYAKELSELVKQHDEQKPFGDKFKNGWANFKNGCRKMFGKESNATTPLEEISNSLIKRTHVAENIKVVSGNTEVAASSINSLLEDTVKFFKGYQKTTGKVSIEEFAQQSKKLVRAKSWAGLAVVLPLAISMQYINRWITGKVSGTKGAPIYDDFGKNKNNIEENPKSKEGLLKQKIISISSMLGVSLLSMMKKPTLGMLEFKGMFPTMDQARIISTATFSSRMAAADDKNELAEATVRDIATFSSLYFLGDYAAKAAATVIQNNSGVTLLNDTKPIDKNANIFKKFWHWVKDVNIKSSEEVLSKTEEMLKAKGITPDVNQLKTIESELSKARYLRTACQVTNIGVSLAILGIIIPIFTRKNTKKKHEQALKLAQENAQVQADSNKQSKEAVTPLNISYSNLTTGFRSVKN